MGINYIPQKTLKTLKTSHIKNPQNYNEEDRMNYTDLMIMTDALHRNKDPSNPYPKASGSDKWIYRLSEIWF